VDEDVAEFASNFSRFVGEMHTLASLAAGSPVRDLLDRHLGEDSSPLPVVAEGHAPYDHVNLQVALDAYLAEEGRTHELVGFTGQQRRYMTLADLVATAHHAGVAIGSIDFVNLPISPDETLACVAFGLYLIEDRGSKLAALVRAGSEETGRPDVVVEVLCADRETARGMLHEVRRLMVERNVFRGQMISFGESRIGHVTLGPIVFHRRPRLERDAIVLPGGVLEQVERQVFGIAAQRDRLRAAGQHVKRGLLLHGPPGTGKTLTARYVAGRATDHTIVVLTGGGLGMIRAACSLARMLQPSIVILEDVDLVAQHRMYGEQGNPLLFDVLNEMDGIEEDADVAFLLTTNRADLLEPALAARPGRVDLAVDIPVPDADARRRLLELYGRGLELQLRDVDAVVSATGGVTASFVKELVRKAALVAALRDGGDPLVVTDQDVDAALRELLEEGSALTRVLLGAGGPRPGTDWLSTGDSAD
jgi:cell division protease FtsH